MKKNQLHLQIKKQDGFVLVLALVLLAVMTLIGVSSMNSANMELRATSNIRQYQIAFAAGQGLMDYATSDTGVGAINYQTLTPNSVADGDANAVGASAVSANVAYVGCSVGIGSSLEEGKGFNYNFYTVNGTASSLNGSATSLQNEGVRYPAAGCTKVVVP